MKAFLAGLMLVVAAACSGRQVEVQTGPTPQPEVAIHFTNGDSQGVNVYVNSGGNDMFVKMVAANSTEHLPVPGVSSGAVVTLKATRVDGSKTYTKSGVSMSGMTPWQVP